ncbi:unnamed protein product (macronuclear) [Paramecium tetraurelia]|uniref:Uncharacterized protein n=1 Tax=Paramecium tetraurelia TaxID=5888 RepID=A0DVA4_PARTE|nr:uncharacterized protein GSPATT00020635001 [Paramecium tetraurelia]CAK86971.1 unnamed protein product [Paramecium tetraurelia]|eukprot:XP_001454368.1 hypothetical protein (macronuclear) [Paramecium tetraurelia strain d4-2]
MYINKGQSYKTLYAYQQSINFYLLIFIIYDKLLIDYSSFPFTERRVSHLVLNQITSESKTKIRDDFKKTIKKNSLLHSMRMLKEHELDEPTPIVTEKQLQAKKFINLKPLKKAIEKITLMRQEQLSRRKSAYGDQFGEMTAKQFQNLPTTIEQHKQIDGQRFALTSFADILERKKRKRTTKKPSLIRQLSKQESLVEYDHLERPPSCKTPPKQIIIKQQLKSQLELTKEKQFKQFDKKMISFLSGKPAEVKEFVQRKKAYTINYQVTTPQSSSITGNHRNSTLFPSLHINKFDRYQTNYYESKYAPQLSNRQIQNRVRPYITYNRTLIKFIKSEIKNGSQTMHKSIYNL